MSILKKYSKQNENNSRSQPISSRLSEEEYKAFYDLCEQTGYSISEAVRLLIQEELSSIDARINTESIHTNTDSKQQSTLRIHSSSNVNNSSTNVNKGIRRGAIGNRFTTNPWNVDNRLPCGACGGWISKANFSRHAKNDHGMTTQEIFTKFKDQADEMVKALKSTQ